MHRRRREPLRLAVPVCWMATIAMPLVVCWCSGDDKAKEKAIADLPDSSDPAPGTTSAPFQLTALPTCGSAGFQSVAAAAGSKVAFATLATTQRTSSCKTLNGTADVAVYDICYVESSGTGTADLTASIVTSQPYLALTGVGLALTRGGQAQIAFTGGGAAELRCGGTDLQLVSGTNHAFSAARTLATGSESGGLVPDQASNCVQDVCNSGDATGFWPTIAVDANDRAAVAFRDIHFGFANDDFASSDVEFARGDGFASTTVDVARGGGTYLRLAFTPAGLASLVHYSAERDPGIWLNRETAQGWVARKLFTGKVGEQIGFGISSNGLLALAYYDEAQKKLQYTESNDGTNWTAATAPDLGARTGLYPSLAFDPTGEPAIAYYRCSDRAGTGSDCEADRDGLLLARRKSGIWSVREVVAKTDSFEGLYPALAFLGAKAVIGYQARSYDPIAATSSTTFWIAEEP